MRMINTNQQYWELEAWNAAENRESFYVTDLTEAQAELLKALEKRFRRPTIWSPNSHTVYFNPPLTAVPDELEHPDCFSLAR